MILGVCGSGRRPGNSWRLLQEALTGAAAVGGAKTHSDRLADLSYRGCVGCAGCRTGAAACVLEDALTPVLQRTMECSALALAAPIYYGYPSGLFKSYLDRWYSFRDGDRRLRLPTGRSALLILTQGHPDPDGYRWTVESLEKVLRAYGFEPTVWVAAGLEGTDAAARPELLERARSYGAALLHSTPHA